MSIDLHYFRYLDARSYRFVRFSPFAGDAPGDAEGEPTPGAAPERAVEDADDSDASTLQDQVDAKVQELQGYAQDIRTLASDKDLPKDHPFYLIDDPAIREEGAQLLEKAAQEISTSCIDDLNQALSGFHDSLGLISDSLSEALLASFSAAPSNPPERRESTLTFEEAAGERMFQENRGEATNSLVLKPEYVGTWELIDPNDVTQGIRRIGSAEAAADEVETVAEGTNYTIRSGDTMYDILTTQLADSTLRSKVAERYGLSPGLAPKDLVLQLFANTKTEALTNNCLGQNLIYPGDKVVFNNSGLIQYFPQTQEGSIPTPPAPTAVAGPSTEQPEEAPASTGDAFAQLDEEPAADDELESESDADRDDRTPEPMLEDEAAGSEAEAVPPPAAEAAPAPAVAAPEASIPIVDLGTIQGLPDIWGTGPEVQQERVPQTREDFMAAFPGLRINPNDFPITVVEHPTYAGKNLVRVQINRFALRGKIQQVAPGDLQASASSEGGEGDDAKALGEALTQLTTMFRGTYKVLTEQSQQEHADSNHVPEDFHELNDFLASPENNDIYDLKVTPKPQSPEKIGDPFRYNIKITFEVDGYPGKVDLHWPTNPEIRGKTMEEARKNAYAAIMLKYLPDAVAETREEAAEHADTLLATEHPEKLLPVTPSEQYAYFRDSITERADGIYFQFFHPVASLNTGAPCEGLLKPNGTLHLIGPSGLDVSFQLSYTARQNGADVSQEFGKVRLIKTRSGSYAGGAEPRSYKEFMREPLKPWVDKVSDSRGNFVRADLVIGDGFLYDVVRDALAKPARRPDGTERPDPETFLGQYRVSNDSPSASRVAALPSDTNYLWIKPVKKKL